MRGRRSEPSEVIAAAAFRSSPSQGSVRRAVQPRVTISTASGFTVADFKRPVGPLRQTVEYDHAGRKLIKFYGDPEACWGQFKGPVQRVIGWNPSGLGRGADVPGAIRPVGTLMSDGSMRRARGVGE